MSAAPASGITRSAGRAGWDLSAAVGPAARVVLVVLELVLPVGDRRRAGQLALQSVEVGELGVVLQLPGDLLLLRLGTAAPHGSTPSLTRSSDRWRPDLHSARPRTSSGKFASSYGKTTPAVRGAARIRCRSRVPRRPMSLISVLGDCAPASRGPQEPSVANCGQVTLDL